MLLSVFMAMTISLFVDYLMVKRDNGELFQLLSIMTGIVITIFFKTFQFSRCQYRAIFTSENFMFRGLEHMFLRRLKRFKEG